MTHDELLRTLVKGRHIKDMGLFKAGFFLTVIPTVYGGELRIMSREYFKRGVI